MASEPGPSSLATAPSYAGAWSNLRPRLDDQLEEHVSSVLGFKQMTPVQSSVIPLFLSHKDVIVEAVTGSGKTLAYALPVIQMLRNRQKGESPLKKSQVGALLVCPTRELAIQVHRVIEDILLGLYHESEETEEGLNDVKGKMEGRSLSLLLSVGGSTSSPADDYRRFKDEGSDIIVGTPGRIEELLKRNGLDTKELEVLILDEADRLLDMGFQHSLTAILQVLPKQRRSGLFSATMTDALGELVRVGLRNPVRIVVKVETKTNAHISSASSVAANTSSSEKRMPATLENMALALQPQHKLVQLIRILRRESQRPETEHAMRKSIVYFATCAQVNYFFKILSPLSVMQRIKLYSLHGKQTPARRRATFDAFVSAVPLGMTSAAPLEEQASVLLCTDVAARGLDLPNVDLVVQFDPPTDPKVFSHRCGRTARAGRHGRAIVLLNKGREESYVDFLKVRKNPVRAYPYMDSTFSASSEPEEPSNVDEGAIALHQSVRNEVRKDRALYELGMQAFVSFIQCYRKHEISFVFRERDLNLGAIAYAFGLLRLPIMPEVDRWRKLQSSPSLLEEEEVDLHKFAYLDKLREKQRLGSLESRHTNGNLLSKTEQGPQSKGKDGATAWSVQKARKDQRQIRRDKKQRKRAFLAKQDKVDKVSNEASVGAAKGSLSAHQQKGRDEEDDAEDWADEERLAKKARRDRTNASNDRAASLLSFDGL